MKPKGVQFALDLAGDLTWCCSCCLQRRTGVGAMPRTTQAAVLAEGDPSGHLQRAIARVFVLHWHFDGSRLVVGWVE
jgi:hypothetical protein